MEPTIAHELVRKTAITFEMIKLSHTVFALPFALSAMLLAEGGWPRLSIILWILVAMAAARSAAMAFNRWADRDFDRLNPRTEARALPRRRVGERFVLAFVVLSSLVFVLAAGNLNRLCLALAPVAILVLLGYSFAKRFTSLSHLWLGIALGLSPIASWLAVRGALDASLVVPAWIGLGVTFWVAGFDVIYACQDADFDRRHGLHSLPARVGVPSALRLAACFHVLAIASFALVMRFAPLQRAYLLGVAAIGALLAGEHWLARSKSPQRLELAFRLNSAVGVLFFAAVWSSLP